MDDLNLTLLFYVVFSCIVSGIVGAVIGSSRNAIMTGFVLGLLLGPIGWIISIFIDYRAQCSECKGRIPDDARKCLHCGSIIELIIDVRCPACGERGRLRESQVTEEISCPTCKKFFLIASARV